MMIEGCILMYFVGVAIGLLMAFRVSRLRYMPIALLLCLLWPVHSIIMMYITLVEDTNDDD